MKIVYQILFPLLLFILQSAAQDIHCAEFRSPKVIVISTKKGDIEMPEYGSRYKSNQMCEWIIFTNRTGYVLQLDVEKCELQGRNLYGDCNNDYVDVFDSVRGQELFIGRFCESDKGKRYRTTSNKMIVRFYSDAFLEHSGFEVEYQAVPFNSNQEDEMEPGDNVLQMAIGIPACVLVLTSAVILVLLLIRIHKRKTAGLSQATTQNFPPPYQHHLPGGCPSSDTSHPVGVHNSDIDPFYRTLPLQVVLPGSANECSRNAESTTLPPAYDTLGFSSTGVEIDGLPSAPPLYDVTVKHKGPTNH